MCESAELYLQWQCIFCNPTTEVVWKLLETFRLNQRIHNFSLTNIFVSVSVNENHTVLHMVVATSLATVSRQNSRVMQSALAYLCPSAMAEFG